MAAGRNVAEPVLWLWRAGLRFGGIIDVGCGEGYFSLAMAEMGPFRFSTILNIDAQDEYRDTLSTIQEAVGGHFRICAVGERDSGTIDLVRGKHPYWSSVRPPGDRYWAAVNELREDESVQVPIRTIDSLVAETGIPGPYLLKLDVQGAEREALLGAKRILGDTSVVLVETLIEDFSAIHDVLAGAGFDLFDVASLNYVHDGVLAWFYPVYVNTRHRGIRPVTHWDPALNADALALQDQHRDQMRSLIDASLARLDAGDWQPVPD